MIMKGTLLIFFSFLLISSGQLLAQKKGYSEGYIVTLKNDTIIGLIKSKNKVKSCNSVSFLSNNGVKEKYTPREIKLYSKTRKTYFSFALPGNVMGTHVFMKELVKGKTSLYVHYKTKQSTGNDLPKTVEIYYLKTDDSSDIVKVRSSNFKAQLGEFTKDNTELSAMILNKEYRYDDIEEIVELYNEG